MKLEGSVPPPHIRETWLGSWQGRVMWSSPFIQQMGSNSASSTSRVETAFGVPEAPTKMGLARDEKEEVVPCLAPPLHPPLPMVHLCSSLSFRVSKQGVCCGLTRWDHITEKYVRILSLFEYSFVQVWGPEQLSSLLLASFYFSVRWTPKIRTCYVNQLHFGFSVFCACGSCFWLAVRD